MDKIELENLSKRISELTFVHIAWDGHHGDDLHNEYLAHKPDHLFKFATVWNTYLYGSTYNETEVEIMKPYLDKIIESIQNLSKKLIKRYSKSDKISDENLERYVFSHWKILANEKLLAIVAPDLWLP